MKRSIPLFVVVVALAGCSAASGVSQTNPSTVPPRSVAPTQSATALSPPLSETSTPTPALATKSPALSTIPSPTVTGAVPTATAVHSFATTPPATAVRPSATAPARSPTHASATATKPTQPSLIWRSAALDGDVYGSPVVGQGRVYVATQANSLYALDEASGKVLWRTTIGPPVPRSSLPCGNVSTTGILSRPVLDPSGTRLYGVAFVAPGQHYFVAVDAASGQVLIRQPVDPPGANPLVQQQRSALVAANGNVYVAYGGLWGDCGPYHGWVVAVGPGTGQIVASYQVPTNREGGIWAPAAPLVSPSGDLYVATGNGDSTQNFDYGNSVLRLSPSLALRDWFAPTNWATLNAGDTDIGSTAPVSAGGTLIFQIGKSGQGYLLRANNLGHLGGEAFSGAVCGAAFGGTTFVAPDLYVPCENGLVALRVDDNRPSFSTTWQFTANFPGQPVIASGVLWTITRDGGLVGLAPSSGKQLYRFAIGPVMHFASPTAADGYLFAPGARQISTYSIGP